MEHHRGTGDDTEADRLGNPIEKDRTALFMFLARKEKERSLMMKKVAVIMGSDSDLPVAEKAISTLASYGVPAEVHVFSAHRTPEEARAFSVSARENGFGAIIAFAGMAGRSPRIRRSPWSGSL